jgi:hypothetical protein
MAQLDHVAEQDQPIASGQRLQQAIQRGPAAKQIGPGAGGQMKIGDDEGAQLARPSY